MFKLRRYYDTMGLAKMEMLVLWENKVKVHTPSQVANANTATVGDKETDEN